MQDGVCILVVDKVLGEEIRALLGLKDRGRLISDNTSPSRRQEMCKAETSSRMGFKSGEKFASEIVSNKFLVKLRLR